MKKMSVFFVLLCSQLSWSQISVPDTLEDWKGWVNHNQSFQSCPFFSNSSSQNKVSHVCAWPETLLLNVDQSTANFSINWTLMQDSWVPLPGDDSTWPQNVEANSRQVVVIKKDNKPQVFLTKGDYKISGSFEWLARPERIQVPSEVAALQLRLDDKPVNFPVKQGSSLWLGEGVQSDKQEANSLEIDVNRLIIDGHPMTMFVAIDLYVSGVARNEKLGNLLNSQLQVTDVSGDLSAYVDQQGDLWAQLKPGNHELLVNLNIKDWPETLPLNVTGEHWPEQEIWAFQDNKNIRLTQVSGVAAINPEQADSRWDQVPNFLVNKGDEFTLTEQKRGTLNQSEQLTLYRKMWLAFDGKSYQTQDRISGEKLGTWRLNAESDYSLLSAKSHDETLLITASTEGLQGVELRRPAVELEVTGVFIEGKSNNITAWDANFDSVNMDLFLPHGYMALAANNVDTTQNVWIDKWRLWDIFIVMLLTALSYRILRLPAAVYAFLALVLGYQMDAIPLFAMGHVLVVLALLGLFHKGKLFAFIRGYAVLSFLGLLVLMIPSIVNQARLSLHPQLEKTSTQPVSNMFGTKSKKASYSSNKVYQQAYRVDGVSRQNAPIALADEAMQAEGKIMVTGSKIQRQDMLNKYQAGSMLQAGRGMPDWKYNAVSLSWDGPITSKQSYQLLLVTPGLKVLWRLLFIVMSVLWLLCLLKRFKLTFTNNKNIQAAIVLLMLFASGSGFSQGFPDDKMLQELNQRLNAPAECEPNCAFIESASVTATEQNLTILMKYHAKEDVLIPIPSSADWYIQEVTLNGQAVQKRIKFQHKLWIQVKSGVHDISMNGLLAGKNNLSIDFPIKPGVIKTTSMDWQFAGVNGLALSNHTLQLIASNREQSTEQSQTTDYQPFVKVNRYITFDDQWHVVTTITRVSPINGVINVAIPLLVNEHLVEKIQTDNSGAVLVSLGPNQETFVWRSRIDRTPQLQLKAVADPHYIETWELISSPQWHVDIAGIPLVASEHVAEETDDYFVHNYMPRPNESLLLTISRPEPVAGKILSIESINNVFNVGKRSTKVETLINYRATQGGRFEVNLDPQAEVKKVSFDGVDSNLVNENGVVAVSFLPGSHRVSIEWHVNQAISSFNQTPGISTNHEFVNLSQTIKVPRDRWVLWGGSQGVGPAFLYWGELLVFLLIAFGLARVKYSPLKMWQWVALGCAFGTFSWEAFLVVVAWLMFVGWKARFQGFQANYKNILLQWAGLIFTFISVCVLIAVVGYGLLSYPDMGIVGKGSSASQLFWYTDMGQNILPNVTLISVHIWWYKLLILLWSVWVSMALMSWVQQLFKGYDKALWWPKRAPKKVKEKDSDKGETKDATEENSNEKN